MKKNGNEANACLTLKQEAQLLQTNHIIGLPEFRISLGYRPMWLIVNVRSETDW